MLMSALVSIAEARKKYDLNTREPYRVGAIQSS
jgi:hypothetical protein